VAGPAADAGLETPSAKAAAQAAKTPDTSRSRPVRAVMGDNRFLLVESQGSPWVAWVFEPFDERRRSPGACKGRHLSSNGKVGGTGEGDRHRRRERVLPKSGRLPLDRHVTDSQQDLRQSRTGSPRPGTSSTSAEFSTAHAGQNERDYAGLKRAEHAADGAGWDGG